MACSKYQYVKAFEEHRVALLQTYIVVRIDGRGFTKFCSAHNFEKPNDIRGIKLMNEAALGVCLKFKDIFLAYGQSDEYSFVLSKDAELFSRRIDKIQTCLVSLFTSLYISHWQKYFPNIVLTELPSFDARIIQYPNLDVVKDYFRWRQVDCHINNLYNTVFWCMVKKGMKNTEVEQILKDTNSGQKNEILFGEFGINYNDLEEVYRKGTSICYMAKQAQVKKEDIGNKTSPKIRKELKVSIRQVSQLTANTDKILSKLQNSEIKQDIETFSDLQLLKKQMEMIQNKYKEIDERTKNLQTYKQKGAKIQLKETTLDLIKDQFWENIRIL